jgi:hypothetical protein
MAAPPAARVQSAYGTAGAYDLSAAIKREYEIGSAVYKEQPFDRVDVKPTWTSNTSIVAEGAEQLPIVTDIVRNSRSWRSTWSSRKVCWRCCARLQRQALMQPSGFNGRVRLR